MVLATTWLWWAAGSAALFGLLVWRLGSGGAPGWVAGSVLAVLPMALATLAGRGVWPVGVIGGLLVVLAAVGARREAFWAVAAPFVAAGAVALSGTVI